MDEPTDLMSESEDPGVAGAAGEQPPQPRQYEPSDFSNELTDGGYAAAATTRNARRHPADEYSAPSGQPLCGSAANHCQVWMRSCGAAFRATATASWARSWASWLSMPSERSSWATTAWR